MVKTRRGVLYFAAFGLLLVAWMMWRPAPPKPVPAARAAGRRGRTTTASLDEIPRIDLARLDAIGGLEKVDVPPRDPGVRPTPPPPPPPPPVEVVAPVPVAVPSGPPPPPPINMTYLGSVEKKPGLRVAVFVTDKKTVLTGREGEVVGSRVRVIKIGIESVDVEDLSSGRSQRMALPKKGSGGADTARDARDKEPGGISR
jgi:hypothetical protein